MLNHVASNTAESIRQFVGINYHSQLRIISVVPNCDTWYGTAARTTIVNYSTIFELGNKTT